MSYIALANITLTSAQSSVTFGSIPTSVNGVALRDLVVIVNGNLVSGGENILLRFNGDGGSNYTSVYMLGAGSGSGLSGTVPSTSIFGGGFGTTRANSIWNIMDYSATDKHKTALNRTDRVDDATYAWAGRWANNVAINSVTVRLSGTVSFAIGSSFALYGIAG